MQISSNLVIADPVHGGTVLQEQIDDRTLLPPWAYCAFASGGEREVCGSLRQLAWVPAGSVR